MAVRIMHLPVSKLKADLGAGSLLVCAICVCASLGCGSSKPGHSGGTGGEDTAVEWTSPCPIYSGLPGSENLWHGLITYESFTPQGVSNIYVTIGEISGWDHQTKISSEGFTKTWDVGANFYAKEYGYCSGSGYEVASTVVTWTPYDAHFDPLATTTTTTTYDPPMLLIPDALEVGTAWDITSTKTVTTDLGAVRSVAVAEHREAVAIVDSGDTYHDAGLKWESEVLQVDSSTGATFYYRKRLGLFIGPGLVVSGTEWEPDYEGRHAAVR